MYCPTIIAVGFSRLLSLARLLESINNAYYPYNVNFVISLDGGGSEEVVEYARKFQFKHGVCKVIEHPQNLGLRNHILWCGDQSKKYGSVIILEDDLIVDPYFYFYASEALLFFQDSPDIAGISLYAQKYNEYANMPFEPEFNGMENYFMQVTCSWGQAWSHEQWEKFRIWYSKNGHSKFISHRDDIPESIKKWPETSWKKYFSAYLVDEKKYFSYPYHSYTTNCSDSGGVHNKLLNNIVQVPMSCEHKLHTCLHACKKFNFVKIENCSQQYDAFMEPINPYVLKYIGIDSEQVNFDFFNLKSITFLKKKKYCITSKKASHVELYIPLRFKPVELNIKYSTTEKISTPIRLIYSTNLSKDNAKIDKVYHKKNYCLLLDYYCYNSFGIRILLVFIAYKFFLKLRII